MTDWDDAFDNMGHIPNALSYIDGWPPRAQAFRNSGIKTDPGLAYGTTEREKVDFFLPEDKPRGLVIFIHGGYWMKLDRSYFSDLAQGSLHHGWAFAIPSYTLAPEARISGITLQIARAIQFSAEKIGGPICLAGHSAGGHLVTRMICLNGPLDPMIRTRIQNVLSISGLHDLRNLRKTELNQTLKLTTSEAISESTCLLQPMANANITCWVGAAERPEFFHQSSLLQQSWEKVGANIRLEIAADKHHLNVCDALKDPESSMITSLLTLQKPTDKTDS